MKNIKLSVFFIGLIFITNIIYVQDQSVNFDVMQDFAYPISHMQSVRQDLNQAVYFLQSQPERSVVDLMENAAEKLQVRLSIDPDDRDYIQAMIDQINALIDTLEGKQERSIIIQLCDKIQQSL